MKKKEEGHYTIKRVVELPKRGNSNWLYSKKNNTGTLTELFRWDGSIGGYETLAIGGNNPGGNAETDNYKIAPKNFNFSDIPSSYEGTTLVIREDYDLEGSNILLPKDMNLQFEGGTLSNGTITLNDTTIEAASQQVFSGITLSGRTTNKELNGIWFGMKGDDVFDNSNILNAVNNYLTSVGGGVITIPNGDYRMKDVIIRGRVSLIGEGENTVIKPISAPTQGILNIINPSATISNLKIDGDNIANIGIRIYNNNSQESMVLGVRVLNCLNFSVEINDANHITILDSTLNNKVLLDGADNCHVTNSVFEGFSGDSAIEMITTGTSKTANSGFLTGNWFETRNDLGYDVAIKANMNLPMITGNHFHLPYTGTVAAIQVGSESRNAIIENNNFQTVSGGLALDVLAGASRTYANHNVGLSNATSYNDAGTKTKISNVDVEAVDKISLTPLNSDIIRVLIDPAAEKIQYGDNVNNYIRKEGANLLVHSNSRTNIETLGNNISITAKGTNGAIYMASPMRFNSFANLPSPTSYLRGVSVYDFTNHRLNITDGTKWNTLETTTKAYKISSTTTVLTSDDYYLEITANNLTVTLPTSVGISGKEFVIKNTGVGNTVTVLTDGSETIEGQTSIALSTQYASLKVVSNGTNWIIA